MTKLREVDADSGGGFWQQAAGGHAGDGVDLKDVGAAVSSEEAIDAAVNFGACCLERGKRGGLDLCSNLFTQFGGAMIKRFAGSRHPRVLVVNVVEAFNGFDVNDRQNQVSENADSEFLAFNEFFHQRVITESASVG